MKNIKNVSKIVEQILTDHKGARNSDPLLYYMVCMKMNPVVGGLSFGTVLLNRDTLGVPNYESVRRSRQKLQHDNPELKATEEVTEGRYEVFKEVRKYVSE